MAVVPTAKALYLCEEVDVEGGLVNLYGLADFIQPRRYPHTQPSFACFAQLTGGLGDVRCHIDIRFAETYQLIHNTNVYPLHFPDRASLRYLSVTVEGCCFENPGLHLVELYCDNTWVADTVLRLQEVQDG
ncbi:MAG: hypothetical protein K2V38_22415 [Gemmataceae bacterium]|nr:hypothetical protein [Gemmataceae bacterium]